MLLEIHVLYILVQDRNCQRNQQSQEYSVRKCTTAILKNPKDDKVRASKTAVSLSLCTSVSNYVQLALPFIPCSVLLSTGIYCTESELPVPEYRSDKTFF